MPRQLTEIKNFIQGTIYNADERDIGVEFNQWNQPEVNKVTFQSTLPRVFFGGDY